MTKMLCGSGGRNSERNAPSHEFCETNLGRAVETRSDRDHKRGDFQPNMVKSGGHSAGLVAACGRLGLGTKAAAAIAAFLFCPTLAQAA